MLFLVVWIVYANALHDSLAFDDVVFAASNGSWELGYSGIGNYFTSDVWASAGQPSGLYRPLFLLAVAAEIKVFGGWYMGSHLINVLLHSLVTLAVFALVRYLLLATGSVPRLAGYAALLSALIFAVHPVNTEVVNSIFNRSGMLVTLGITAGLSWFLPTVKSAPLKAWAGINLVFLLILFCKETAIMFPSIIVAALLVDTAGGWRERVRKCVPVLWMILPICLFFALRSIALSPADVDGTIAAPVHAASEQPRSADATSEQQQAINAASEQLPTVTEVPAEQNSKPILNKLQLGMDLGKLVPASKVWFDGLAKTVWPHPLLAFHGPSTSKLWLAVSVQTGLLGLAVIAFFRGYPGPLLGLVIYYLALLPSSRILAVSAILPHLAERYLYLPSVGLAISLGFFLYWLFRKFSTKTIALLVVAWAVALTPLTWARNADWISTVSIAQSDYDKGSRNIKIMRALVVGLVGEREWRRARQFCDKNSGKLAADWSMSTTCGLVYSETNMASKAEKAYRLALNHPLGKASAHYSLAILYVDQKRAAEAAEHFDQAIAAEQQAFMKEYLAAEKLLRLYPDNRSRLLEAKGHLEASVALQPQVLFTQQKLAELNAKLGIANDD